MENNKKIIIRVDGNRHIGMGHFFRCLNLAIGLKKRLGAAPEFYILASTARTTTATSFLDQHEFPYTTVSDPNNDWLEDTNTFLRSIKNSKPSIVILDLLIPDNCDKDLSNNNEYIPSNIHNLIYALHHQNIYVVSFSDQFDRMTLKPDLIINTCPEQKLGWYDDINEDKYLLGPDFYILADPFYKLSQSKKTFNPESPKVVVTFGGNDHIGYTDIVLPFLLKHKDKIRIELILGAATPDPQAKIENYRNMGIRVHHNTENLAPLLFDADMAITTAGNTLFDLAALGVPAAVFSTRDRQYRTARYFVQKGFAFDLGLGIENADNNINKMIDQFLFQPEKLTRSSGIGKKIIDGKGLDRLSFQLSALI